FGCISLARDPLRAKLLRLVDEVKAAGKRVSFDPNFRSIMTEAYDSTLRYVAERADVIKVSHACVPSTAQRRSCSRAGVKGPSCISQPPCSHSGHRLSRSWIPWGPVT